MKWDREFILAAIEDAGGVAIRATDPLPDTLICKAQECGITPAELTIWIHDTGHGRTPLELAAWARRNGIGYAPEAA